jgi:Chitobiase/beta-hexosaminidase C-terminal domain
MERNPNGATASISLFPATAQAPNPQPRSQLARLQNWTKALLIVAFSVLAILGYDGPNAVYENMFSGTVLIAINASGQVTGTYEDANYVFHAFLAVPAQGTAAATPTFNPAGGTYTSAQTVTLSDSTNGATIYYTTDGSTPPTSATTSTYTDPITVNSTQTIQAIATASGFSNSALASAMYTINLPAPDFQLSVSRRRARHSSHLCPVPDLIFTRRCLRFSQPGWRSPHSASRGAYQRRSGPCLFSWWFRPG